MSAAAGPSTTPGVPPPSPESLAHRARISSLISSLRAPRFRTSVFNLLAHRIPTMWTLYRGLLQDAPTQAIRDRVRFLFRRGRLMRKATDVKEDLARYHKWRDLFALAKAGDLHTQAVLARYNSMLDARRRKERALRLADEAIKWRMKLDNRPILTGGVRRPTLYHGPLPQMTPMPRHVRMLIGNRIKARMRRLERSSVLHELLRDLQREREFEAKLAELAAQDGLKFKGEFNENHQDWRAPYAAQEAEIHGTFARERARLRQPFPPELIAQVKDARREKIANKTRELQRERTGMVLRRTIKRRLAGPPAHVLAKMSGEQRLMDKVVRSVSEVGYVGTVKRRLGWKLRDPEAWKKEIGLDDPRLAERLRKEEREIWKENERRRESESEKKCST